MQSFDFRLSNIENLKHDQHPNTFYITVINQLMMVRVRLVIYQKLNFVYLKDFVTYSSHGYFLLGDGFLQIEEKSRGIVIIRFSRFILIWLVHTDRPLEQESVFTALSVSVNSAASFSHYGA